MEWLANQHNSAHFSRNMLAHGVTRGMRFTAAQSRPAQPATTHPMPKTAKTRVARHLPLSPAASLSDQELKTLIILCDAGIESNISPRFTKELTRIKGKLRRGF